MTDCQFHVSITRKAFHELIDICQSSLPQEACGVLAVSDDRTSIDVVIPIRNVHEQPSRSFSFDPAQWTEVFFDMQKNRQRLVGFFHSHPGSEAFPSLRDNAGFVPASGLTYWIVSLKGDEAPVVRPYQKKEACFESLTLVLA